MKLDKKDEGLIQYVFAIIIVLIAFLLIAYELTMRKIDLQKQEIEDGITSSALAAAVIDLNEYGAYKYIRSNNGRGQGPVASSNNEWGSAEDNLLEIFKENLQTNLKLDSDLKAQEDSIIDGQVKITKFWVYNHELVESKELVDPGPPAVYEPIMIKDYKGRWIRQHEETDDWYIYKYSATEGGYNKTAEKATKEADGFVYTPEDKNVIFASGATEGAGSDGAGAGRKKVDSMTIYATIEFYVKPFGYGMANKWGIYDGAEFHDGHMEEYDAKDYDAANGGEKDVKRQRYVYDKTKDSDIEDVGKIKIVKSVVVDVQPREEEITP